ncbi:pericentrin [Mustela nigripes]|uniref:pericentrin n=1 Tax=Mustela nigripes TaxID=77151 RepID=UPI002816249E|nr:pericentrin [Mustela nigripes]
MDLSSWSSPEVVRKDSTLEPAPSLPLTPCSDSLSLDASLQDRTSASLQADQVELLGYLAVSESLFHTVFCAALGVSENSDPSAGCTSAAVLPGLCEALQPGDGSGFGELLNQGSGRLDASTASPAVPPPASGRFQQPLEAMKEKGVHLKQVKYLQGTELRGTGSGAVCRHRADGPQWRAQPALPQELLLERVSVPLISTLFLEHKATALTAGDSSFKRSLCSRLSWPYQASRRGSREPEWPRLRVPRSQEYWGEAQRALEAVAVVLRPHRRSVERLAVGKGSRRRGWRSSAAESFRPCVGLQTRGQPLVSPQQLLSALGCGTGSMSMNALLQMVCDESQHILALSERHGPPSTLSKGKPSAPLECFPREGSRLLEAVPALRRHETLALHKGEKEPPDTCLDWREFLQVVQEASGREWEVLRAELQPQACAPDPGDHSSLLQRLEKVVQEQGRPVAESVTLLPPFPPRLSGCLQEKSLEHLRLSDRSSLLAEIQALRAQLRMTHLQNQEKLQQLCGALTSAEARGSRQEHQLRRQVELLAYKVEQEKRIASDVQKTLKEEQEKAGSARKLLAVEQTAVRDLRAELRECKQDNERLLASLSEAQKEVLQLRSVLDGKESSLKAALQELECERGKEHALRGRLEEQRLRHLREEGQSSKTLEVPGRRGQWAAGPVGGGASGRWGWRGPSPPLPVGMCPAAGRDGGIFIVTHGCWGWTGGTELRTALEQQCAQSSRLRVALEHEQTATDNLRRELQIEASRCEALLAQEQGQLCELRRSLEAEKGRSRELAAALRHERLLTEQLSRGARNPPAQQAPPRRSRDERARVPEPQARLEQMQQRAAELERDKEVRAVHSPGAQPPVVREPRLAAAGPPAGLECTEARPAAREGHKDSRRRVETGPGRADAELRPPGDKEKRRELELQRQRDQHKIRQLQRTVQALEAKEAACQAPEAERLQEERLGLEKVRQQLLCAAGLLTNFVSRTVDRTISDWTSSNEKAVTSLLCTLEELKSELSTPGSSQRKMRAELQTQLVDVLLKDNDSLTTALRTVTQEKAELCRAVSQLEKSLKQHLLRRGVCSRPDKSAWKQDGAGSQSSARQPDPALPAPAAREEASSGSVQVEKLYLHYLRAESFRKALIYQKKYLLLLIGGFQDSEQETLSMIAHLGVFPSKADKKITPSRPFTKFRTAVRVVIAILRLRFLVKKWQEVDRKGAIMLGRAPRPAVAGEGVPVPRQQAPPKTSTSPPTRDVSSSHAGDRVPKASPRRRERSTPSLDSRSERSLAASQDPERSLTEYIHHLEMVQQRLAGAPPDSASKRSCRQKTKQ